MSFESERNTLLKKHQEELRSLETKHAILQTLNIGELKIEGYKEPFVHTYKLYGSMGSINFGERVYTSIDGDVKSPDGDLLRVLLAKYPPMPLVKVSDGCTSFRPDYGETWIKEGRTGTEYECHGVTVRINPSQYSNSLAVEWYTRLDNGNVWQFKVDFALYACRFGRLDLRASRYGGNGPIERYEVCQFYPDNEKLGYTQKITWGSGGEDIPNQFTLYWDKDTGSKIDFPAFVTQPKTERG